MTDDVNARDRETELQAAQARAYRENTRRTLYSDLVAAGAEIGSHESDLHVKDSPRVRELLAHHLGVGTTFTVRATRFCPAGTHETWWDVPFMYQPWWDAREARRGTRDEARRFESIDRAALKRIMDRRCNWPKCEDEATTTVRLVGGIVGQNYYCAQHADCAVACGGREIER